MAFLMATQEALVEVSITAQVVVEPVRPAATLTSLLPFPPPHHLTSQVKPPRAIVEPVWPAVVSGVSLRVVQVAGQRESTLETLTPHQLTCHGESPGKTVAPVWPAVFLKVVSRVI